MKASNLSDAQKALKAGVRTNLSCGFDMIQAPQDDRPLSKSLPADGRRELSAIMERTLSCLSYSWRIGA